MLRILFSESGPKVPLAETDRVVSSQLVEIETFRAVDRERLLGNLDDAETARKGRSSPTSSPCWIWPRSMPRSSIARRAPSR